MKQESGEKSDGRRQVDHGRPRRGSGLQMDEKVKEAIDAAIQGLEDSLIPYAIHDLNAFQRRQVHRFFARRQEYEIKTYRQGETFVMKVFPVGALKRLAEQKAQEVLMRGEPVGLPPMGSYARFVVHNYLKERGGVSTQSSGDGEDRHVEIFPVFGRTLKKAKRRLT